MPALIERPKMTRAMYQALKRHIMAERERKKQAEEEADAELERQRQEEEIKRKKEEEHSLTLEQTKEQIAELTSKLESLKSKKHELFSELKKVLHQDEESRKRKEQQNEVMIQHQFAQTSGLTTSSGHPAMYYQGNQTLSGRPAMFKPSPQVQASNVIPGMKRQRSPSPPPTSVYSQFGAGDAKYSYSASKPQHGPFHDSQKGSSYAQSMSTYSNRSSYPSSVGLPAGKYNPPNQSAFTSYPTHYAQQQKQVPEPHQYHKPTSFQLPRQPSYHSSIQQGQSQREASSTSGYSDDKLKIQTSLSQPSLHPGQVSSGPSTSSKGVFPSQSPSRHSYTQQNRFY